jgi:hypothetical protein
MPTYLCDCGTQLLIVPDLQAMNKAIEEHLIIHKNLTGKILTEEKLTQKIIKCLCENLV